MLFRLVEFLLAKVYFSEQRHLFRIALIKSLGRFGVLDRVLHFLGQEIVVSELDVGVKVIGLSFHDHIEFVESKPEFALFFVDESQVVERFNALGIDLEGILEFKTRFYIVTLFIKCLSPFNVFFLVLLGPAARNEDKRREHEHRHS